MRKQKDPKWQNIIDECPNLYAGCDQYVFGVDDGWYSLIRDLSIKLEPFVLAANTVAIEDYEKIRVAQIKEKFGGLRFYVNYSSDEMNKLISDAESQSYEVCEQCGEPGTPTKTNWIKTLCENHKINRYKNS